MFNPDSTLKVYRQVLDLPTADLRQEWLSRLDQGFLHLLERQKALPFSPRVEVRFDGRSPSARPGLGLPGNGLITMGGDEHGHVLGADGQPYQADSDPVWHRWGVLLHEAGHVVFETLGRAFLPEDFPPAMTEVLNTYVFALFLSNPMRHAFAESFADCFSSLILMNTERPEARIEVENLLNGRRQSRQSYDQLAGDQPDAADRIVHRGDLALQRVLHQTYPIAPEEVIECALSCASDGLVDHWRMGPARAFEALERSWLVLDPMYAAGKVRRAFEGGFDLTAAWAEHCPKHPLVRLWGPVVRESQEKYQEGELPLSLQDYTIEAPDAWKATWEAVFRRAMPAISHALEGYRSQLEHALHPPALGFMQRRLGAFR